MTHSQKDLRRDPELLREHLVGDAHAGPGLIERVRQRVVELTFDEGPKFTTASVAGVVDHHHVDSTAEAKVFELLMGVRKWMNLSWDAPTLRNFLRMNRISDVDMLVGSRKVGEGLLTSVARTIRSKLKSQQVLDSTIDECLDLAEDLMNWLGDRCAHEGLAPLPGPRLDVQHLLCPECGVRVNERHGQWLAV